ncbi:hypothetical protein Tco_1358494, partial [Tanacetum coccineum]
HKNTRWQKIQDDDKRLCLVDDIKEAQVHMQVKLKGTSSSLKSKDHYAYHKLKDKDSRLRAEAEYIHRISDTRPPMLDRTDFAPWQQRIRLYCRGKENGVNILMSIDEGPFQMGTFREILTEGTEGAPHLGPKQPRVYSDLSPEDKERYNADIRETNILLQGLPKDIYSLINHYTDAKDIWDNVKMFLEGSELTKEDHNCMMTLNTSVRTREKPFMTTISGLPNSSMTCGTRNTPIFTFSNGS